MFKKIQLPYELDSLEPYISKETMDYHFNKHHTAYEKGLENIIKDIDLKKENIETLEQLMKNYMKIDEKLLSQNNKMGIRQFGGGLINHNFYFLMLAKNTEINKESELYKKIIETYESFEKWEEAMINSAMEVFGSGWTWLVLDKKNNLKIFKTFNQDNPWFLSLRPLIGIDVWEHAYYIDYRNDRKKYLQNHMKVINWNQVEENYNSALAYNLEEKKIKNK